MTQNGISTTTTPGQEQYEEFSRRGRDGKRKAFVQYDYRSPDGVLFSCIKPTLEACRTKRDAWLREGTLAGFQ